MSRKNVALYEGQGEADAAKKAIETMASAEFIAGPLRKSAMFLYLVKFAFSSATFFIVHILTSYLFGRPLYEGAETVFRVCFFGAWMPLFLGDGVFFLKRTWRQIEALVKVGRRE